MSEEKKQEIVKVDKTAYVVAIVSVIGIIITIISNVFITKFNNDSDFRNKQYEVTFNEKKRLFSKQMELSYTLEDLKDNLSSKGEVYDTLIHHKTNSKNESINYLETAKVYRDSMWNISNQIIGNSRLLKLNTIELYPFLPVLKSYLMEKTYHLINLYKEFIGAILYKYSDNDIIVNYNYGNTNIDSLFKVVKRTENNYEGFMIDTVYYDVYEKVEVKSTK